MIYRLPISEPLLPGVLLRRYKRFLADVRLDDGRELTVHCPNPGRMTTCAEPGAPVRISDSGNPRRKLRHTLEMVRMGRTWIGVNTMRPNAAAAHFVQRGAIPELAGYDPPRAEVVYGDGGRSRIDLLLEAPGRRRCFVEIKNTTLRVDAGRGADGRRRWAAAFPDAVTERGRKHLEDLASVVAAGERAVLFFFVGRADCTFFRPADEVDPAYGAALRQATAAGVEALAYRMRWSARGVEILERLEVDLTDQKRSPSPIV